MSAKLVLFIAVCTLTVPTRIASATTTESTAAWKSWKDPDAPRRIRQLAHRIESRLQWPGLSDFLVAVAWTESRGESSAHRSTGERGWFQIFPRTADSQAVTRNPDLLKDEHRSVAIAADLAWRLAHRWGVQRGHYPNWAAIRRGWKYPRLVQDVQGHSRHSRRTNAHFAKAIRAVGLPHDFASRSALPARPATRSAIFRAAGLVPTP